MTSMQHRNFVLSYVCLGLFIMIVADTKNYFALIPFVAGVYFLDMALRKYVKNRDQRQNLKQNHKDCIESDIPVLNKC